MSKWDKYKIIEASYNRAILRIMDKQGVKEKGEQRKAIRLHIQPFRVLAAS